MELPTIGKIMKLSNDATIWGKQIEQLNNPKYVPMCLPDKALDTIVNG